MLAVMRSKGYDIRCVDSVPEILETRPFLFVDCEINYFLGLWGLFIFIFILFSVCSASKHLEKHEKVESNNNLILRELLLYQPQI